MRPWLRANRTGTYIFAAIARDAEPGATTVLPLFFASMMAAGCCQVIVPVERNLVYSGTGEGQLAHEATFGGITKNGQTMFSKVHVFSAASCSAFFLVWPKPMPQGDSSMNTCTENSLLFPVAGLCISNCTDLLLRWVHSMIRDFVVIDIQDHFFQIEVRLDDLSITNFLQRR